MVRYVCSPCERETGGDGMTARPLPTAPKRGGAGPSRSKGVGVNRNQPAKQMLPARRFITTKYPTTCRACKTKFNPGAFMLWHTGGGAKRSVLLCQACANRDRNEAIDRPRSEDEPVLWRRPDTTHRIEVRSGKHLLYAIETTGEANAWKRASELQSDKRFINAGATVTVSAK